MKILITGGAGYIGSELVNFLLKSGHSVIVADSLDYEPTSLLRYCSNTNFEFVKLDIRRTDLLKDLMSKCDVIIPLACLVGFPVCEERPHEAVEINYKVNKWIADNKSPNQIVIYPCTNSGYGSSENGICTEESPMNPISIYGKTKVDAEKAYQDTEGCCTLRLATVFGPSTRPRTDLLVNNFVLKAIKDRVLVLYECEFMRNYVHIWDICRVYNFILDNWDKCSNKTFNIGNDDINMNKLQLAEKISEHIPLEIIKAEFTQDPDKRDYEVSSQKIYNLGFQCDYNLDDGIKQLIKMYKILDQPWHGNY
jgi:nucleoside-diphosphate-sugar epimerase|tara:strand:+ start:465 stop:1391 length:927 start_codon:yes stop_codon:yes gene_type:complete